jgi:hypothetical protein
VGVRDALWAGFAGLLCGRALGCLSGSAGGAGAAPGVITMVFA